MRNERYESRLDLLKGAEAAARESGYGLLFAMSNRNPTLEIKAAEALLDHQVDGLIVISSRAPERCGALARGHDRKSGILAPLILVNNEHAGSNSFSVRNDNQAGA